MMNNNRDIQGSLEQQVYHLTSLSKKHELRSSRSQPIEFESLKDSYYEEG